MANEEMTPIVITTWEYPVDAIPCSEHIGTLTTQADALRDKAGLSADSPGASRIWQLPATPTRPEALSVTVSWHGTDGVVLDVAETEFEPQATYFFGPQKFGYRATEDGEVVASWEKGAAESLEGEETTIVGRPLSLLLRCLEAS